MQTIWSGMTRGGYAIAAALVLGVVMIPAPAGAAIITIDFNNVTPGTFTTVSVGGGAFEYGPPPFGSNQAALDVGSGNIVMVDGNSSDASGAAQTLTRVGSGLFSVRSIDIADLSGNQETLGGSGGLAGGGFRIGVDPGDITLPFATSAAFTTIDLSGFAALQNISAFHINIVSFAGVDEFAIDNIVIETPSVPEPASLALLALGVAGFGFVRRRYRAA